MPKITTDFVLIDLFKILPGIPYALLQLVSTENKEELFIMVLRYNLSYDIDIYDDNRQPVKELELSFDMEEALSSTRSVIDELKLQITEAIMLYDYRFQVLDAYYFNTFGNLLFTFNTVRISADQLAVQYDIFDHELDDRIIIREYSDFIEMIRRDSAASEILLQKPSLTEAIRRKKLGRIFSD